MTLRFSPSSAARVAAAVVALTLTSGPELAGKAGPPAPASSERWQAWHVLNRTAFGPRPGAVEAVEALGVSAYIERQLHPEQIHDDAVEGRLKRFATLDRNPRELVAEYLEPARLARRAAQSADGGGRPADRGPMRQAAATETMAGPERVLRDLMQARLLRAMFSERQLQEVLVDFWFNHFNVFVGKGQVRYYLTAYERDVIRPHVFGRFRDLLGAVAHSPAMLLYLDNWQSAAPADAAPPRRVARGNAGARAAARGGLNENYARELLELHTLGVDGGYTERDVVALARIFTGWTIDRPRLGGDFVFRPAMHDRSAKELLGVRVEAAGEREGERALDLLARHPSTARHIAYKLAQRFVADVPPPSLVDRASAVFQQTDGDLRAVVRTILLSPEFLAPDAARTKIKTPLEFAVSALRAIGADVSNAFPVVSVLRTLGMPLYGCQAPTGYDMTADAWVNAGALLGRMNAAVSLVERYPRSTTFDAPHDLADALLGGASEATRHTLERTADPETRLALTLGSPEFQRR